MMAPSYSWLPLLLIDNYNYYTEGSTSHVSFVTKNHLTDADYIEDDNN